MLDDLMNLLIDILLWLPRKIYEFVGDIVASFMSLLPSETLDVQGSLSGWSGDVLYFLTVFEVPTGIPMVFTALIARFILRRIPVIG